MDQTNVFSGNWVPSAAQGSRLRELYRGMIVSLNRRIGNVIEILKRTNRWDNTLFVVTSDHGQAFGEHGALFHSIHVWEPILRIPLVLRLPDDHLAGTSIKSWTSLMDLEPTCLAASHRGDASRLYESSVLSSLDPQREERIVLAMADGLQETDLLKRVAVHSSAENANQVRIAGYLGDLKVVLNASTGQVQVFDLSDDLSETTDLWSPTLDLQNVMHELRRVAAIATEESGPRASAIVEERLRSWGY
jgi:arylsulfatase A-like enzyme